MSKLPEDIAELVEESGLQESPELVDFIQKLSSRWLGINTPFISGGSTDKDVYGLPKLLFICPAYGLDGFAVYEKKKEYDAPSY